MEPLNNWALDLIYIDIWGEKVQNIGLLLQDRGPFSCPLIDKLPNFFIV